jgi:predicted enzyme related to lactoylglutathione lyase
MGEAKSLKVGAIVFYVKDLNRSEAFYRDTMAMKTSMKQGHYNETQPEEGMLFVEAGEVTMIFFQRNERVGRSPIVVFTLADGGIDALVENLAKRGVQIVLPVSEAPGGWTSDFLDPDGHMLSFYQSSKSPR